MLASELTLQLIKLIAEHGDLPIGIHIPDSHDEGHMWDAAGDIGFRLHRRRSYTGRDDSEELVPHFFGLS